MGNPKHLEILQTDVNTWNEWRKTSTESPNLSLFDLGDLTLDGIDFEGANLGSCRFVHSSLKGANLRKACLDHVDLDYADLSGADVADAGCPR
jgi:uncharacterized protein YjbI with pentapeptide repeats